MSRTDLHVITAKSRVIVQRERRVQFRRISSQIAGITRNVLPLFVISLAARDILLERYTTLTAPCWFQEPAGIFELIEVVGNGTYGQVYKASILRISSFSFTAVFSRNYDDRCIHCRDIARG